MQFSETLQQLMAENNVTARQLAKELRIPSYIVDYFIRGTKEPAFGTLKRIAAYFNVDINYLLDHHGGTASIDDDLLRIFHSLPSEQQLIFLAQGKAAARITNGIP